MNEWDKNRLDRRNFLTGIATCGAAAMATEFLPGVLLSQQSQALDTRAVAEVFLDLDRIHKWDMSNGDTWDPFWADDGNLYAFNCDGRGFGAKGMNLAFNRLTGESPSSLVGAQVNQMDDYGKGGQKEADNATWKACGQECIDNVFYAFVSRNTYGSDSKDPLLRQLAVNSSLIKSTDRGRTWMRNARENYDQPMWPGSRFGAPFFIHYGQNGGRVARDGASEYVYAISTNGFWNDGDSLVVGRVKRSNLSNLNSKDWEYYAGANWSPEIESAAPVLQRPAKCGQTPVSYIPSLGIYLLISWYNTAKMTKWFEPNEVRYDFYQANHPWGPWRPISSFSDRFLGPKYHMYGPSICARFQEQKGEDVEVSLFTAGCPFDDVPSTPYKMWHIPVLLRTSSLPTSTNIAASDAQIRYHGTWFPLATVPDADVGQLPRATQTQGSSAELSFEGTGIDYIAQKSKGLGSLDIYLDGVRRGNAVLDLEDFPVLFGVVVFSQHDLQRGKHSIKLVSTGDARVNLEAFRVYA